jgi:hypothetical protein
VRYPLDVKGAEVLLVTPSADFFAEPHVESLIGYGKVFHAAGISWTLSSKASEAGNFGMFIGNYEQLRKIALRIREAALELGVKRIVVGECGHAWRVAYSFWNTLVGIGAGGKDPFAIELQQPARRPLQAADAHLRTHARPDPARRAAVRQGEERRPHHHLPRLVQRGAGLAHGRPAGRPVHIPRDIIKAVANRFHDMAPEHHPRGHLLLRWRRRPADRRPARAARQGRAEETPMAHIVIVGAGLGGMPAAYELRAKLPRSIASP